MWQHNYEPLSGSLGLSAIVAAVPVFVLFLMLGVLRRPAWMSALTALVSAFVVALGVYGMPVKLALISTVYGAAFGIFPIAWIVFAAIMLYRLAVDTGKFEIIKDSVGGLSRDRRLQAMFIAFSFGAFIEGAAGFGAPVAISGAMLAGLGFNPFYAAGICLLANTAPVAFGSIGIPVTTLANITGLPVMSLSAMVGRLCAMISLFIPAYLVVVMAGGRRALQVAPAIIACGLSFAATQFTVSNFVGPELTDIAASLTCIGVMVVVMKLWTPRNLMHLEGEKSASVSSLPHGHGVGVGAVRLQVGQAAEALFEVPAQLGDGDTGRLGPGADEAAAAGHERQGRPGGLGVLQPARGRHHQVVGSRGRAGAGLRPPAQHVGPGGVDSIQLQSRSLVEALQGERNPADTLGGLGGVE